MEGTWREGVWTLTLHLLVGDYVLSATTIPASIQLQDDKSESWIFVRYSPCGCIEDWMLVNSLK